MNKIRTIISAIYQSPMQDMTFPDYFKYVNEGGKVTPRSLLEVQSAILTYIEEQEKINEINENTFKDVEEVVTKLVNKTTTSKDIDLTDYKVEHKKSISSPEPPESVDPVFSCPECGKTFTTQLALTGHSNTHKKK